VLRKRDSFHEHFNKKRIEARRERNEPGIMIKPGGKGKNYTMSR
jgi:hypothetical protein